MLHARCNNAKVYNKGVGSYEAYALRNIVVVANNHPENKAAKNK